MFQSWTKCGVSLLVAGILVAGCGNSSGGGGGFSEKEKAATNLAGVFRYPIVTNPTTLDPAKVEDGDTIDLLQQVFEGLVFWDESNKVAGKLAEKWEILDGGTTYKFTLKQGVKFHSGKEMTSADVKWSIERACRTNIQSAVAEAYMGEIIGVKEMVAGKATTVSGVTADDKYTVTIKIDKPRPYWLGKFTYLCSAVMDKDVAPLDAEINKPELMAGTGPFKVSEYQSEQVIKLTAFADYHGGAPKLKSIERVVVKDPATRLSMYKAGDIDLLMLERQDVAQLEKDPKYSKELVKFDRPVIWYVGLSPTIYKPFADRRVRQAFAMAIDKNEIVNEVLGGINEVANCILPPSVPGHRATAKFIPFDVAKAKALLAEAGYVPGKKELPPLSLMFREKRADVKSVSEAVARQLDTNLGVKVKLENKEWRNFLEMRNRNELPLFHLRWAADYLDPENYISFFFNSKGPENKVGYANDLVDTLTNQADIMADGPDRLKLYQQAEDLVLQDAIIIPIYFQRDVELINPRISGLKESDCGHLAHSSVEAK